METRTFDSTDVGEIEHFLSGAYSKMRIEATAPGRSRFIQRTLSAAVNIDDLDHGFGVDYAADPPDAVVLCDVFGNTIRRITETHDETFGPGESFLLSRPGFGYRGFTAATKLRITRIDPDLLTRVAQPAATDRRPVRLLDTRPVSAGAVRHLQRSIAHLRDSVLSDPETTESPLLVSTAAQYLAASVLHAFPNTALTAPTPEDHHDAHPATVRRAIAYIDTHLGADVALVDVAAAAHVSTRALQYAFRQHLEMTPMAYLRRARLDAAHRELLAADPTRGATVTTIAARWGFPYPSRFAATYRQAYGQRPHTTLHT